VERALACEAVVSSVDGRAHPSFCCALVCLKSQNVAFRALTETGYASRWSLVGHGLASEARSRLRLNLTS
jgi:hypothetical protein